MTAIRREDDGVVVHSARADIRCRRVIVAMSPADAHRVAFTPRLPTRRATLQLSFVGTAGSGSGFAWPDDILDDAAARKAAFIADLVTLFGPDAATPTQYLEHSWIDEPWIAGCVGTRSPGVMTQYTDAVATPVDRIHWAGTEAAPLFENYLEGAVRSAQRAADEVCAALRRWAVDAPHEPHGVDLVAPPA